MKNFFKQLTGVALLLLSTSIIGALINTPVPKESVRIFFPLLMGFAAGLAFFMYVAKWTALYVFAHELTHWIAAKLFRRRTGRFRVGLNKGSVEIENPNIWITLAPYFIPFYAMIWIGISGLITMFADQLSPWLETLLVGGVGLAYAHHVFMTADVLRHHQSDLQLYGPFYSLSLIVFCNSLGLFLGIMTTTRNWGRGFKALAGILNNFYLFGKSLITGLFDCVSALSS